MSDPIASTAQLIAALDKLMNTWRTAITLLFTPLFFVLSQKVNWLTDIPDYVLAVGALGAGAGVSMCLQYVAKFMSNVLKHISYAIKQSRLTYDQYAILKMCLMIDRSWYNVSNVGDVRPLDDALQRFLEANLGRIDTHSFKFDMDYWKWVNKRRRKVIAKEVPEENTERLRKRVEEVNANASNWAVW